VIRWIAFDGQTASAIDGRVGAGSTEIQSGDPLCMALGLARPSMVVLRSSTPGKAVLVRLRPILRKTAAPKATPAFEPSGFLGLSDAVVFLDDSPPAPPKKHWWQRKKAA